MKAMISSSISAIDQSLRNSGQFLSVDTDHPIDTRIVESQSLRKSGQFLSSEISVNGSLKMGLNPFVSQVYFYPRHRNVSAPYDHGLNPFVSQVNFYQINRELNGEIDASQSLRNSGQLLHVAVYNSATGIAGKFLT